MAVAAEAGDAGAHRVDGPAAVVIDTGVHHQDAPDVAAPATGARHADLDLLQRPGHASRRRADMDENAVRDLPGELERLRSAGGEIDRQKRVGRIEFDSQAAELGARAAEDAVP